MDAAELTQNLKLKAHELGFSLCGVCPAVSPPGAARLDDWLAAGYAGQMQYIAARRAAYDHPSAVLDGARTLFVTGSRDEKATPADMQEFAARVAGAAVAIIPNASHEQLRAEGGADLIARECAFIRERVRR